RQTEAEIILCLDADTIFHPDAIGNLVRHFHNPKVGAVAGNVKIGNRINLLTIWQTIEYITSQNLDRRAFDLLNCITVVPGAIGAWRRDIVNEIGGFPTNTLAEDADLTISVLKRGYIINNEPDAIALTEAPDNFKGFIKQRFRWVFGTLQVTWKHRNIMFKRKYGTLGMFALPNIFIFQTIYPFVSPIMDLTMAISLIQVLINKAQHPLDYSTDNLKHILFYYAIFISFDFFTSALAFMLEKKENWRLLGWVFVQRFVYRQIMYYIGMKAVLTAIRGGLVGWGKLERKGFEH
ncbi:MAG: glycosyltransferase family 2 protein, partial [Candidatus Sericytochromatia bacterium]|nr:glycosyltransferase family 2 protein [Candidatus Sericytochromatia bacterium]